MATVESTPGKAKTKARKRVYDLTHREQRKAYRLAHREQKKAYHLAHREEIQAYKRAYHLAHREKIHTQKRAYHLAHREKICARVRAYRLAQPEKKKAYNLAHRERDQAYRRVYCTQHPEVHRAAFKRRRALLAGAPINDLTHAQWLMIQATYDHRCVYCHKRAKGHLTQEHLTPLSKHGSHTLSNVVPACRSCNSSRKAGPVLKPVQPLLL